MPWQASRFDPNKLPSFQPPKAINLLGLRHSQRKSAQPQPPLAGESAIKLARFTAQPSKQFAQTNR